MDISGFNANDVQPVSFDVIPDGLYEAMITETEERTTAAGDKALNITFTILDERYKDRNVWEFLNINHSTSEKAKQIARGKLSAICRAVGVLVPGDTTALHNIPFMLKVGQEKRQDTGEMKNVAKDFKPKGSPAAPAAPALSQVAATPAAGSGASPWKR
jgi:hypothetical protein